jgi:hypothetical protein
MHTPRSTVTGRLLGLLVISLGLVSPAAAQKPNQAQCNAVRQSCAADYQTYCANVPTGGAEPETRHCTNGTGSHRARPPIGCKRRAARAALTLFTVVAST